MKRIKLSGVLSCAKDLMQTCLFILFCLAMVNTLACEKKKTVTPPPPVVEVVTVDQKDVPIFQEWVGALDGYVNAVIRPQVTGYLIKQNYREGELVKKGQILFEIDPRTFQASLNQAQAQLSQQKARHETTKANLARIRPLAEKNAVSQKDLDDAIGAELSTGSSVEAAHAAVENAQLNLGFTKIISPVDGIAGIAKAQLGDLVGPGMQTELTAVSTVNPIKVYINVSEQEYLKAREGGKNVEAIPLQLILADGSVYPHKGKFALSDRQVDPTTGTIKIGTVFPNPNNMLRPGGYGLLRAQMEVKKGAILVPQRAVGDVQGKNLVAVVGADNKVELRPVKVGGQVGSDSLISEGLKAGETIVVEGIQKVKSGMTVSPKPFTPGAPADQGAVKPGPKQAAPAPAEKR
jgi:membrane fusion protein, multidrug efflux system